MESVQLEYRDAWRTLGTRRAGDDTMTTTRADKVREVTFETVRGRWDEWRGWVWKGLRDWTSHLSILATELAGGVRWQWKPSVLGVGPLSLQARRRGAQGPQSEGDSVMIAIDRDHRDTGDAGDQQRYKAREGGKGLGGTTLMDTNGILSIVSCRLRMAVGAQRVLAPRLSSDMGRRARSINQPQSGKTTLKVVRKAWALQ